MPHHLSSTRCLRFPRTLALTGPALILLVGCTAHMAYQDSRALVAADQIEAGLLKYQQAIAADPGNALYKSAYLNARDRGAARLVEQAERELADGKADAALRSFQHALSIEPANERARAGLRLVAADARHARLMEEATVAFQKKDVELARQKVDAILSERPNHELARLLLDKVTELTAVPAAETGLAAAFKTPINIEFRDASLKQVFEVISRRSGLNFLFDKDVKTDQRTSIFLKNSSVEAAIYFLLLSNQLEQQVMDDHTILIFPNTSAKKTEYQELVVRSFFLTYADAKTVANTLKTILKSREVVVDEKLNLLIVRDSPEAIKLAARLVALQDVAEPEVMLDVEILEITRSRLMDLGVAWPTTLGFAPLQTAGGAALTIDTLRQLNSGNIGVSGVSTSINANKTDTDSNTLANPRIRVRNKEKAKVVIGDKVPNITTIITPGTSGGFASEQIAYVDVGLTLNVEPTIYLNNELAIRISLEVSNLVDSITTKSGSVAYRIGTRSASTMLQLKDGENQVLAGLINNQDRSSGNKVPGFGNLPLLGRLFGSTRDQNDKTEIVLSITPHLIRNVQRPELRNASFRAGTESSLRNRPESGSGSFRQQTPPSEASAIPARPDTRPASGTIPSQPVGNPGNAGVGGISSAPGSASSAAGVQSGAGGFTSYAAASPGNVQLSWQGPAEAKVGTPFTLTLTLDSVQPINNLPLAIGMDSKVLQLTNVAEGDLLRHSGAPTNFSSRIDPNGQIVVSSSVVDGGAATGTAVILTFRPLIATDATSVRLTSAAPSAGGVAQAAPLPAPYSVKVLPSDAAALPSQ